MARQMIRCPVIVTLVGEIGCRPGAGSEGWVGGAPEPATFLLLARSSYAAVVNGATEKTPVVVIIIINFSLKG